MLCEKCQQNQATVHMKQIFNGSVTESHLCQECAGGMDIPISFENIFHGFLDSFMQTEQGSMHSNAIKSCDICGMTYEDIRKSGRFGCENCYSTFKVELEAILKNVQGSTRHEGKFPKRAAGMQLKREIEKLKLEQMKAIENEEYEEAARIRDLLKEMEMNL